VTPANGLPEVKAQVTAEGGFLASKKCGEGILEGLAQFGV
jgi:hypothetical protein